MNEQNKKAARQREKQLKLSRLQTALRDNLQRRKEQQRARNASVISEDTYKSDKTDG